MMRLDLVPVPDSEIRPLRESLGESMCLFCTAEGDAEPPGIASKTARGLSHNRRKVESLVFTCATGRCGTAYLAHLFDAEHEPEPKLMKAHDPVLRARMRRVCAWDDVHVAKTFLEQVKLPHIESTCKTQVYLETAHTFSKGYLLPLIDLLGERLKLIRLRREPEHVVASLLRLRTIPPSERWYLKGTDAICVERLSSAQWHRMSPEERCTWYVDEIERQWSERVKPRLRPDRFFEVNLEDLLAEGPILDTLQEFVGLPLRRDRIGVSINTFSQRQERAKRKRNPADAEFTDATD